MFSIPLNLLLDSALSTTPTTTTTTQTTTAPDQTATTTAPTVRRYWPNPNQNLNLVSPVYEYQDINHDMKLRKSVTKFYNQKVLKWLNTDKEFQHLKSKERFLESNDGLQYIYSLLRHFVKRSGINWYDLRDNYSLIKRYLSDKIK
jgi:hypothetical protein